MIRLHLLLRDHPAAVEAHLSRYDHLDLRDLYTTPPRLTRRQIAVRLRWIPDDSPVAIVERGHDWTRHDDLLDRIRMQTAALVQRPEGKRVEIKPDPRSPHHERNRRLDPGLASALDRIEQLAAEREDTTPEEVV
jgi:hypothetical protein